MSSRTTWVVGIGAALLLACGVAGCGAGSGAGATHAGSAGSAAESRGAATGSGGGVAFGEAPAMGALVPAAQDQAGKGDSSSAGGGGIAAENSFGPLIVKTAALTVEIGHDAFDGIVGEATDLATKNGGYVVSSEISGDKRRSGHIVLRVPADRFDPALKGAAGLGGGKVTSRAVNGQDVTPEYIDLSARLTNQRAQEKVLLRLMDEAATVTDTIRVQSQLSAVQGQIEQLEGRVRYLRDQASMSTLTMTLTQAGAAPAAPSEPNAISQAFRDAGTYALDVVTTVIAGAGLVLPLAILAGIAFLVGRAVWRRVERPEQAEQEAQASA
jgi:hypothetical protein